MYGGCALSMEQSEVPPKAAADLRVGCASGLALRGSGGAGFHVRLTPQCRGAVGCGSVCGVAAAGTANAVGGALSCGRRRGCGWLALFGGAGVAGARGVWRWSAAQGLRALGRFVDAGWQDLRAVHDSRGPCSERRPFLARSSRGVFPNSCLQGFSDAWRAYLAKASSFRMHGVRILPRTGDFPVRGRFRDAWSAKLATDCRPGTHRGGILPRQSARERTAREYCHCQSGQGRIRAQSRHRRTLGNAFREHFAIVERPGTHRGEILPLPVARERISRISCHRRAPGNA